MFILRLLSFGMGTFLRIAVAIANNSYSMAIDIFVIMADILKTNIGLEKHVLTCNGNLRQITYTNRSHPLCHTHTQTDECFLPATNDDVKSSNTDSSKKLSFTPRIINYNSKYDGQCDSTSAEDELLAEVYFNLSLYSSSNMSIEKDVSDGKILQTFDITNDMENIDKTSKSAKKIKSRNWESNLNDTINISDDDLQQRELLNDITCAQKTSSPIKNSAMTDPYNKFSSVNMKGEMKELEANASSMSDEEDFFENTILLNDSAKYRLSLPSSFKISNEAHYEAIKNEISEAIKNTSRDEKSLIKYPLSGENFIAKDTEDTKEVFSCSSYESLPVSEHLHNAFEKSTFFSLYRENFLSTSSPDFSSVDEFVQTISELKKTLINNEQPFLSAKRLMKPQSYSNAFGKVNQSTLKNTFKERNIQFAEKHKIKLSKQRMNSSF